LKQFILQDECFSAIRYFWASVFFASNKVVFGAEILIRVIEPHHFCEAKGEIKQQSKKVRRVHLLPPVA
jgi:hypothetical protein